MKKKSFLNRDRCYACTIILLAIAHWHHCLPDAFYFFAIWFKFSMQLMEMIPLFDFISLPTFDAFLLQQWSLNKIHAESFFRGLFIPFCNYAHENKICFIVSQGKGNSHLLFFLSRSLSLSLALSLTFFTYFSCCFTLVKDAVNQTKLTFLPNSLK